MLTVEDFPSPVIQTNINGIKCWKYLGYDLIDCVAFARVVQAAGERFYNPLTDNITGVHTATLDKAMVTLLIAMSHYRDYNDHSSMMYPDHFPLLDGGPRGFTNKYAYLVHFDLLSRKRDGKDTFYSLTLLGLEFVRGRAKVCPVLFNSGSQIHGYDKSVDPVNVGSFFSKGELDEMRKPLWFLSDKLRQEILTDEELAIDGNDIHMWF